MYIGTFTFYLNRNFKILDSPYEVSRFLNSPSSHSAVIVKTSDFKKIMGFIPPGEVRILKSPHKGYHVDDFRLLITLR